jgi:hypothetical protein
MASASCCWRGLCPPSPTPTPHSHIARTDASTSTVLQPPSAASLPGTVRHPGAVQLERRARSEVTHCSQPRRVVSELTHAHRCRDGTTLAAFATVGVLSGGASRKWTLPIARLAPTLKAARLFRGPVPGMVTFVVPTSHMCIVALQVCLCVRCVCESGRAGESHMCMSRCRYVYVCPAW